MAKTKQGGKREGSGRKPIDPLDRKYPVTMHIKLRHIISLKLPDMQDEVREALLNKRSKLKETGIIK